MIRADYPETIIEVLDDEIAYPDELLGVMRIFAASKPWSGSTDARKRTFIEVNRMMARACGIEPPRLTFRRLNGGGWCVPLGRSSHDPADRHARRVLLAV